MVLLTEGLHTRFKLAKVIVFRITFLTLAVLVDVGEVIHHELSVADAVTLVTLPFGPDRFDLFETVVIHLLLDATALLHVVVLSVDVN